MHTHTPEPLGLKRLNAAPEQGASQIVQAAHSLDEIHPGLLEVALIDAKACAAAGGASLSWWFDAVREGRAPKPAIKQLRFTRWRLVDVKVFWSELAAAGSSTDDSSRVTALALKASEKAAAKRNGAKTCPKGGVTE